MLGKLIKYDLKNMAKSFIPISIIFVAAELMMIFTILKNGMQDDANAAVVYSLLSSAVVIPTVIVFMLLTFIVPAKRFKESIDSDKSFLLMTLPVKPITHLFSKLICTVILFIASVVFAEIVIMAGTAVVSSTDLNLFTMNLTQLDDETTSYFLFELLNGASTLIFAQLFVFMAFAITGALQKGSSTLTALICILGIIANSILSALYTSLLDKFSIFRNINYYLLMSIYHIFFALIFFFVTYLIIGRKYNLYR